MTRVRALPTLCLLLSCGLLGGCASQGAWLVQEGQHPQSFQRAVTVHTTGRFLLYLPAGFHLHGTTRYPLLIFLHGSGEAGIDLEKVTIHGPPKLVASQPDFQFIVASPQARNSLVRGFDPVALDAMLDELLVRLPIDADRVYLTGLSMGGNWTYGWASLRPERFAAIAPVSGSWDLIDACRLRSVPVWAFHGAKDEVFPVGGDEAMVDAINACGGRARLTVYPEAGHDAWTAAYADESLYAWLLQQRRSPREGGHGAHEPPPKMTSKEGLR
jgi:predicted peptidase